MTEFIGGVVTVFLDRTLPIHAMRFKKATVVDKLLGNSDFAGFNEIDFRQEFRNQGITKEDVDSVRTKSMTLTIKNPPHSRLQLRGVRSDRAHAKSVGYVHDTSESI